MTNEQLYSLIVWSKVALFSPWAKKHSQLELVMIWIHYFFREIFEPAQNGNKCGRSWSSSKRRSPTLCFYFGGKGSECKRWGLEVGRVPQIKHTCEGRKIPFIKNACNNFDEKKIGNNTKGHKLSLTEYKKLTSWVLLRAKKVGHQRHCLDF
jgi:hypothetical protein